MDRFSDDSETRDNDAPESVALFVAYDGTPFCGFARQPGLETVQGRVEDALRTVLRYPVETVGAGRTDTGVHALGQVISFEARAGTVDPFRIRRSLDALIGDAIVVREVRLARAGFSARFDARRREYRYRIVAGRIPPLFLSRFAWHVTKNLDVDAMREGATLFEGEHDFRSFCVSNSAEGKPTVRRVEAVEIMPEEHLGEACLTVRVVGNAFLHSMVRTMVGTLVDVGAGRREPSWVEECLAARSRAAAGQTAPAHGLTLHSVDYSPDVWR
ncbi:MAG: tRNA pseudouridine(38-40) synthase TruA [Actinobacteria bacterium HGW-Actinobacteria-7]|nr:MAG: tRNA pseudouridine(38-40) synthase TruA [Actinobacteria bacterium HGW-Actinobacteria-7]